MRIFPSPNRLMRGRARSPSIDDVSDGTRYSITRKPRPTPARPDGLGAQAAPVESPPRLAEGSQTAMLPPPLAVAPGPAVVKVQFGDVELVVEHRGDDVSLVLPGALRMTAPRAHAMALIAALMKRPGR